MDRRKFLTRSGATLAGAAGLSSAVTDSIAKNTSFNIPGYPLDAGGADPQPIVTQTNDLSPYTGVWGDTEIRHLLGRAMFGVPMSQFIAAKALGSMDAVVTQLLGDQPMPQKFATWLDTINTQANTGTGQSVARLNILQVQEVANWWMDQMISENLSIREKMTLFWSNHFVTGSSTVRLAQYEFVYNQTLRQNALGNFKNFVNAISIDPAMLVYLNGNQNLYYTKNGKTFNNVNENYARELQELFTIGLTDPKTGAPNYTETDIQQAAKALSGWQPTTTAPFVGQFNANLHDGVDTETFYGQTGKFQLSDIVNIILSKGTTTDGKNNPGYNSAYFICSELYATFVYYVPNAQVVEAMANLLVASNWEIKPVMQALLSSAHFYDSEVIGAQLKSPVEFVVGIIRDFAMTLPAFDPSNPPMTGTDSNGNLYGDPNKTHSYLSLGIAGTALGQLLLNPPNVKGWPGGHNWVSTGTFPERLAIAASMGYYPNIYDGSTKARGIKITFSPTGWANSLPGISSMKSHDIATALEGATLSFTLGPNESATLYTLLNPLGLPDSDFYLTDQAVALFAIGVMTLPEYQLI
ncbi:MAG TPA: DUF1800 domain-containing protein [Candidatus Kapabacteria bacterium]|nr:DUF1800 domain-containing protein [Candidatus Kapabacteria bacterium]